MMTIVEVSKLRKTYDSRKHLTTALEEIDIRVKQGEFLVIIGPSGCGKTTLLLMIAGLETVSEGKLLFKNIPVKGPDFNRGIVFQEYMLFPWRTVTGNIAFGPEMRGIPKNERMETVAKYIKLVGLEGFENRYPYELSGGMKQRVAIARALANNSEILLMDEPFGSLDALTREILQIELLRIWQETKRTIIFVTHNIAEAIYLGDRVAMMSKRPGRIKEIIDIKLPRPRTKDVRMTPEFIEYERQIKELIWDEI